MVDRLRKRALALWLLARSERATPRQIGMAVAVGTFMGCSPALGFHGWLAVGAATVLRLNRLYCWVGSRISNLVTLPWIVIAEVQVSHRLRTGEWLALRADEVLAHGRDLLLDWVLGMFPVGGGLSLVVGLGAYWLARWRAAKNEARSLAVQPEVTRDTP